MSPNEFITPKKASHYLRECMHGMSTHDHQLFLEYLHNCKIINQDETRPYDDLYFGHNRWRTYYHHHHTPDHTHDEHGHFHIFAQLNVNDSHPDGWAHVAGLSMGKAGQPLCWFTVNQWVAGGPWLISSQWPAIMKSLDIDAEHEVLGHWLTCMLCLYQHEIIELLDLRERELVIHQGSLDVNTSLTDRNIYTLSEQPIHLHEKLSTMHTN